MSTPAGFADVSTTNIRSRSFGSRSDCISRRFAVIGSRLLTSAYSGFVGALNAANAFASAGSSMRSLPVSAGTSPSGATAYFVAFTPRPENHWNSPNVAGPTQRKKRRASSVNAASSDRGYFASGFGDQFVYL